MRDRVARIASTIVPVVIAVVAGITGAGFVAASPAVAEGEVAIEVMANGEPADSAPGPSVDSGSTVTIRYVITVGSNEPLYDFVVTDETGGATPNCDIDDDGRPDGTNNHTGPLESGDSFFCVLAVVAGDPGVTYARVGRVTAYDFDITDTFVHDDAAHYTTVRPATTQPPTTQAPTTVAPTTAAPTSPPTTAAETTTTSTTSTTTTLSSTTSTTSSSSTTASTVTIVAADEDAAAPDELASSDDRNGFPLWWVVLAFAAGGGLAIGVGSHLADRRFEHTDLVGEHAADEHPAEEKATVPDR